MNKALLFLFFSLSFMEANAIVDTITIRSKPSNSRFRYINNSVTDSGFCTGGNSMVIARWTSSGIPYTWRSLLKFDLTTIPAGSIIDSAWLSVYANPTSPSGNPGSPTWGTNNAVGIYRLTAAWDTSSLTWGTQPPFTFTNGDTLIQSTSTSQNYVNMDVTDLVKDAYVLGNHGFLFKHLQEVTTLNSMIFYSPYAHYIDSNLTPRLKIKYTNTVSVGNVFGGKMQLNFYPNPTSGLVSFEIDGDGHESVKLTILDCVGRVVANNDVQVANSHAEKSVDVSTLPKGIYFAKLTAQDGSAITKKLIIQ